MLKMVDGTGIIGVDMVCPLGGAVSPPQPPNYDNIEMEGVGSLMLPNSLKAPLERVELIGNSVQGENPAPDNPQEIKSTGRKSKNIFNKNAVKQGYEFGSAANDVETAKQGWFVSDFMPVKATTYQISGKKTGLGCKLYNKDKVFVKNTQAAFGGIKFDEGIAYFRINGEIKDLDNIQVEEGTVATDYEPYSDTCLLDVKVTGKNLFNAEKARDITNWIVRDNDGYVKFPIRVGKGNKVTFSYTEKLTAGKGFYLGIIQSETSTVVAWLYHSAETNLNNKHTVVAAGDYIYLSCTKSGIQKFVDTIQTLQVEISSVQTPYEPYTEQSVQIALNEPLRGIGEYKDTITKDGVARKIKQITVNEKSDLIFYMESKNTLAYLVKVPDATQTNYTYSTVSDRFVKTQYIDSNDTNGVVTLFGKQIIFRVSKEIANNIDALKEWLVDNNITFNYVLESPITEPLPESVQAQLSALHSENRVTHVFVDSGEVPCGIKLTYRKEK